MCCLIVCLVLISSNTKAVVVPINRRHLQYSTIHTICGNSHIDNVTRRFHRLTILSIVFLFARKLQSYKFVILFTVLTRATRRSATYYDHTNKLVISNNILVVLHQSFVCVSCQASKFTLLQTMIVWNVNVPVDLLDRQRVSVNLQPRNYAPTLHDTLPSNASHRDTNAYRITADVFSKDS